MDRPADASKVDLVESYRQLAEIYHELLAYEALERLLDRVGDSIARLVPCSSLLIAEVDHPGSQLVPLVVRGEWPDNVMELRIRLGQGLIGWAAANGKAVCANAAHRDPRAGHVEGTPSGDPEAIISIPFVSNGMVLGAMSVYREGEGLAFSSAEFELAQRFGDAATLALVNATTRTELHRLAHSDDLTGLRNRRGFFAAATAALAEIDSRPVALVMLDLDHFKAVNDGYGHAVGDTLLRHCARLIAATSDAEATIGRLGGDEFAVLVRGDDVTARGLATRLQQTVEASPLLAAAGAITAPQASALARVTIPVSRSTNSWQRPTRACTTISATVLAVISPRQVPARHGGRTNRTPSRPLAANAATHGPSGRPPTPRERMMARAPYLPVASRRERERREPDDDELDDEAAIHYARLEQQRERVSLIA